MNDHERGFLTFLAEPTKRRMETLLDLGDKRRRDVRELLNHSVRLDPRYCQRITGSEAFSGPVETILRERGAGLNCYVLGGSSEIDGRQKPLTDALNGIIGMGNGAFVSCIPCVLGFYEYEDMKS